MHATSINWFIHTVDRKKLSIAFTASVIVVFSKKYYTLCFYLFFSLLKYFLLGLYYLVRLVDIYIFHSQSSIFCVVDHTPDVEYEVVRELELTKAGLNSYSKFTWIRFVLWKFN